LSSASLLKKYVYDQEILILPGVFNALSASIAEKVGFKCLYMTGGGVSANYLALPDIGFISMAEMVENLSKICDAVDVPVIADADTGFGGELNVFRTVKEYEKAGAAGIQLEDQVMPKKCGHMTGQLLVDSNDMVSKIKAATSAKVNEDFVLIARTDARAVYGLEEAIKRGKAYKEAGADVIFLEAPKTINEMHEICNSIEGPLVANMVEGGSTPYLPTSELGEIGFDVVLFPAAPFFGVTKYLMSMYCDLLKNGTFENRHNMYDFSEFNNFIGTDKYIDLAEKFKH